VLETFAHLVSFCEGIDAAQAYAVHVDEWLFDESEFTCLRRSYVQMKDLPTCFPCNPPPLAPQELPEKFIN